jgi:hypothetical protein
MQSSKEIERDVEAQRASVESTLGALKDRMSMGQIVDEFGGFVGAEDARRAMHAAGRSLRENPVAFGLMGLGLAWLALGGGRGSEAAGPGGGRVYGGTGPTGDAQGRYGSAFGTPYAGTAGGHDHEGRAGMRGEGEGMKARAQHVAERAQHVAEDVRHAASDAGARMRSAVDEGRDYLRERVDGLHLRDGARRAADRGRGLADDLADAMERQPLLFGAAALVAGAALAAALPATRLEDRWVGDARDDLMDGTRRAATDLKREALATADAALGAAKRAADAEGLTPGPEGKTVAEKVETVVRAAVDEAKGALEGEDMTTRRDAGASPV